jgi:hypothetical protein
VGQSAPATVLIDAHSRSTVNIRLPSGLPRIDAKAQAFTVVIVADLRPAGVPLDVWAQSMKFEKGNNEAAAC